MVDWTRLIGSGLLMAGAILGQKYGDMPNEVILAWGSLVPALWVVKPVVEKVGSAIRKMARP